ncbi:conserved protein of unknown function [Tenacibaculum sp. 190130A14a]|uniref:Tetratricopeptide repeat protein n=1 Tax=Tenacibaculum polynesiense TaxID=3137857 RepID=A0ABM9P6M4_9FLAO
MNLKEKLKKIDIEIENGLKFKAANRLRNLIQENPNAIELRNKLAELYYQSGFLDAAGKYWILTEPTDDRIKKCVQIYEKSVNNSGYQILQEIVFRGNKSKLSVYAQKKLTQLEYDSKEKVNHIPKFYPKSNKSKQKSAKNKSTIKDRIIEFIFFSVLISIVLLIIIGIVTVIKWLF